MTMTGEKMKAVKPPNWRKVGSKIRNMILELTSQNKDLDTGRDVVLYLRKALVAAKQEEQKTNGHSG